MRSLAAVVFLLLVTGSASMAATYVVEPDGTGDFPTIQAALLASTDGDVVELADGVFTGPGNHDIDFWDRAITVRSQSGDAASCVIDCQGGPGNQTFGFTFERGERSASILQGVTITNGWLGATDAGAGVRCRSWSSPTLIDVTIANCEAGSGAALWCQNSSPSVTRCTFVGNTVDRQGAGAHCTNSSPSFDRCKFLDNEGRYNGGVACNLDAAPVFERCVFSGNAGFNGAAVRAIHRSSPAFTECTFTGNDGLGGGVVHVEENASVTFAGSIIAFNVRGLTVDCHQNGSIALSCCDVYGNAGGDWTGCIADQAGLFGNVSMDPEFCSTQPDVDHYWALQGDSPCAGAICGQMGAGDVACGTTMVETATWGAIKASFR